MDGPDLEDAAADLLAKAEAGHDVSVRLTVSRLQPGDVGILEAAVDEVGPVRTYRRKRGGEGLLCRVTLRDATGRIELVLWDEETALARDGPLRVGASVRLRGPTVRDGYRGGLELGLGACIVEAMSTEVARVPAIRGRLLAVGKTHVVGAPPHERFNAEAKVETSNGPVMVVLWDDVLRRARQLLPGAPITLEGACAHPALEGWFVAADGASLATTVK